MLPAKVSDRRRILLLVFEQAEQSRELARLLANIAMVRAVHVSELEKLNPIPAVAIVCDFDLRSGKSFRAVQAELARPFHRDVPRLVVTEKNRSLGVVEAGALGITDSITRPFDDELILGWFRSRFVSGFERDISELGPSLKSGLQLAHAAVARMFEGAAAGAALTAEDVAAQEEPTIEAIRAASLRGWLDAVRLHHSQSYRHCLAVTGVAVAFAQQLGMNLADQRRIARAAIVHDVGKAQIPLAILEKPGRLSEDEAALVREHPVLGHATLAQARGEFSDETLDAVLHHHEMLDGSGYPHGLSGGDVSDMARIVGLADIFTALIEDRPYKPAMTRPRAYETMKAMGAKLDRDLLRAFRPVALYN